MAEEKRRKAAGTYPTSEFFSGLPDRLKADIATVVQSVQVPNEDGGTCVLRAHLGMIVLNTLKLDLIMCFGSMLFRAGSHPVRDLVAFCKGDNDVGYVGDALFGHLWIEVGADLVEFSTNDWGRQAAGMTLIEKTLSDVDIGPMRFEVRPPFCLWTPAAPLAAAWRPTGEPAVGRYWYKPHRKQAWFPKMLGPVDEAWVRSQIDPMIAILAALQLDLRVAAWREGQSA